MAVTLKDIALHVGVSKQAVSATLNGGTGSRISAKKREMIIQAVKDLGYRSNHLARALTEKRTWTIGFINGGISSPFHSTLTAEMISSAEAKGYKLLMLLTNWDHDKELACLEQMLSYQVDGIILNASSLKPEDKVVEQLRNDKYPFIVLGEDLPGFHCIKPDFFSGMSEAFELLLNNGHRKIAIADIADSKMKCEAYLQCCHKYEIEPDFFYYEPIHLAGFEPVFECGRKIAAAERCPDAIIAGNDEAAAMIIKGLSSRGLKVPGDISIVGIDGTFLHNMIQPSITDIVFDQSMVARVAMDIIVKLIEGSSTNCTEEIIIPTRLVERDSVTRIS